MDSGNTTNSDVVITDDIRKRLNIPFVERMCSTLDTALPGSKLTKLGKTETIELIIGNSDRAYTVKPLVVQEMADKANIGSHFLAKLSKSYQDVAIKFDQGEPSLVIGNEKEALIQIVKATQNNFKTMFEYIRRKQQQTIRRNAKLYTGSKEKFRVGMLVWYLSPVRLNVKPTKITDQWLDPYTIIAKETETVFVIRPMTGGRDLRVHVSRMESCDPRYLIQARTPRNLEIVEGDELAEEKLPNPAMDNMPRIPIKVPDEVELMVDLTRRGPGRPKRHTLETPQP